MVHVQINWVPNKFKKIIQYLFILVTLTISGFGVMNYLSWSQKIDPFEINGG